MLQISQAEQPSSAVLRIGFWLSDAFDFYTLARALEPLRLANEVAGCKVCEWQIISDHGQPRKASNGIATATVRLSEAQPLDFLVFCGGDWSPTEPAGSRLRQPLQHPASQPLGSGAGGRTDWYIAELVHGKDLPSGLSAPECSPLPPRLNALSQVAILTGVDRHHFARVAPQTVHVLIDELLIKALGPKA